MEKNDQLVSIEKVIRETENPATTIMILAEKVGRLLENNLPGKENLLKLFEIGFLYLMEKYFAQIGLGLYNWRDEPLPEAPENEQLKRKREKLERKEKRMGQKRYKKRFWCTWYKEWDIEQKMPLCEFDNEKYQFQMDKVGNQIRALKEAEENCKRQYRADTMKTKLEKLLSAILCGFEASSNIRHPVVSYILQTANIEYFLSFIKRACSMLELDVKKNSDWSEKNIVLAGFLFSLNQKTKDLVSHIQVQDNSALTRLVMLQDMALAAESFVTEINNSIVAQRKQEQLQARFQDALESGFKKITTKLESIDNGVTSLNNRISGIDGRLIDILKVNEKILGGVLQNGQLIGSLSGKLDDISSQISNLGETMCNILMEKK